MEETYSFLSNFPLFSHIMSVSGFHVIEMGAYAMDDCVCEYTCVRWRRRGLWRSKDYWMMRAWRPLLKPPLTM